jgi:hypothetical protein
MPRVAPRQDSRRHKLQHFIGDLVDSDRSDNAVPLTNFPLLRSAEQSEQGKASGQRVGEALNFKGWRTPNPKFIQMVIDQSLVLSGLEGTE